MSKILVQIKGGAGSGNWGHTGRPGLVGGSGGGTAVGTAMVFLEDGGEKRNKWAVGFLNKDTNTNARKDHMDFDLRARGRLKHAIVDELSANADVSYDDTNAFIKQWAYTSNDNDLRSLSIQEDAAEEFGVKLSDWQVSKMQSIPSSAGKGSRLLSASILRSLLNSMYERTQGEFKTQGFVPDNMVRLNRGVQYNDKLAAQSGNVVPYQGNAMESWTSDLSTAHSFGTLMAGGKGVVLTADVPIRNIVSTARTGHGAITEGEYIIMGSTPGSEVYVEAAK